MIVSDLKMSKLDSADRRHPGPKAAKVQDHDIYVLEFQTSDGPRECGFYLPKKGTPEQVSNMLKALSMAVSKMDEEKAA